MLARGESACENGIALAVVREAPTVAAYPVRFGALLALNHFAPLESPPLTAPHRLIRRLNA